MQFLLATSQAVLRDGRRYSLIRLLTHTPEFPLYHARQSDKAPFQRPFGEQAKADKARQGFSQGKSDHLAIVEAFGAWRNKVGVRACGFVDCFRVCELSDLWFSKDGL